MPPKIININKLNSNHCLTIDVNLTKEFRIRTTIAVWLIKLATKVLNCNVEIKGI